ncbi:hypothetical protein QQG09_09235 [Melissococcus plutonius]|uniref:hypothetical protein n=1 Tax=Melissococcus plutonius TaxID=33970 RepID=UPI0021E5556B|nr:hypothetical protein [Melissococcus plutonius]MCV2519431.1 hypothetical protein [Melissococcus plutonius]
MNKYYLRKINTLNDDDELIMANNLEEVKDIAIDYMDFDVNNNDIYILDAACKPICKSPRITHSYKIDLASIDQLNPDDPDDVKWFMDNYMLVYCDEGYFGTWIDIND